MFMKKALVLLLSLALLVSCLGPAAAAEDRKISVVVSVWPLWDWVREIAGGRENTEVSLLVSGGVDMHSFQPSVQDIIRITSCDLFVYVGGESDSWVGEALGGRPDPESGALSLIGALGRDVLTEEIVEGMEAEAEEESAADEHIWLSLCNAQKLVPVLAEALAAADPDGAEIYRANAEAYTARLAELDAQYADMIRSAPHQTLLFGDRFPFRYLTEDYGLAYYAAFPGCSAESEASFATIVFLARKTDELGLPAVLTLEDSGSRIAETVVASTRDRNQKILALNSMQGITAADIRDGVTYLDIMQSNLGVLREALYD
jgi:ABC-type metal ion transport system, periplasmic component/surface adhesin